MTVKATVVNQCTLTVWLLLCIIIIWNFEKNPSCADPVYSVGTVHTVEQDHWEDLKEESGVPSVPQRLLLFLFLQHSDPFTLQLSDVMGERQLHAQRYRTFLLVFSHFSSIYDPFSASEVLLEHHLEDILNHNRQAVLSALQTELKNTLKAQSCRKKVSL